MKLLKNFRNENIKGYHNTTLINELNFINGCLMYLRAEQDIFKKYVTRYDLIQKELHKRI